MKTVWLNEKDLFKQSKNFREVLTGILSKRKKDTVVEPDYDSPSWSHKQADMNGYNRAIKDIIELLED